MANISAPCTLSHKELPKRKYTIASAFSAKIYCFKRTLKTSFHMIPGRFISLSVVIPSHIIFIRKRYPVERHIPSSEVWEYPSSRGYSAPCESAGFYIWKNILLISPLTYLFWVFGFVLLSCYSGVSPGQPGCQTACINVKKWGNVCAVNIPSNSIMRKLLLSNAPGTGEIECQMPRVKGCFVSRYTLEFPRGGQDRT